MNPIKKGGAYVLTSIRTLVPEIIVRTAKINKERLVVCL